MAGNAKRMCVVAADASNFLPRFKLTSVVTFVDETKVLTSSSDYESISDYATTPPEIRSTLVTSGFSTPTADREMEKEPEQTPAFLMIREINCSASEKISSTDRHLSLASPSSDRFWEGRPFSNGSELSQQHVVSLSSTNTLTIEGILNKSAADPSDSHVHQSYSQIDGPTCMPPIYSDRPIWPLKDRAEALLLRHFVQNLAIWVRSYHNLFPICLYGSLIVCFSLIYATPYNISRLRFRNGQDHAEYC
jgi:hypothetical protein